MSNFSLFLAGLFIWVCIGMIILNHEKDGSAILVIIIGELAIIFWPITLLIKTIKRRNN